MTYIGIVWVRSENTPWQESIDALTVEGIANCLEHLGIISEVIEIDRIPDEQIAHQLRSYDCILNLCYGIKDWTQADLAFWFDCNQIQQIASSGRSQKIAQDKLSVEYRCLDANINVPVTLISATELEDDQLYIAKPRFGGCHRGIDINYGIEMKRNWKLHQENQMLIQPYYIGREFSVGVIPNSIGNEFEALPALEIVPFPERDVFIAGSSFGETRRVFDTDLDITLQIQLKDMAIKAHKLIGLDYYSRSDFRVVGEKIYLLDVNAMPNLHYKFSILPALLNHHELGLVEFIRRIISAFNCKHKALALEDIDF